MKQINDCTLKELFEYCFDQTDCDKCIFGKWVDYEQCPVADMRKYCGRYEIREINI